MELRATYLFHSKRNALLSRFFIPIGTIELSDIYQGSALEASNGSAFLLPQLDVFVPVRGGVDDNISGPQRKFVLTMRA